MPSSSEQRTEQEQELWRELQANVAAVAACYPSAEALREEAAEAERLAARDGVPPKTAAVVQSLVRRWSAFLRHNGIPLYFRKQSYLATCGKSAIQ